MGGKSLVFDAPFGEWNLRVSRGFHGRIWEGGYRIEAFAGLG